MAVDLQAIQDQISSEVDQDPTATAGSTDWNLRLVYINWAQRDFSETYDWRALLKEVNTLTSQSTGNATVTLPWDFRKLNGYPRITYDGSTTEEFPEINLEKKYRYLDTDRYIYTLGNPRDGYSFIVNGTLASGASINYNYYAVLPSLASPTNVSMCPDPQYLVQKSLFYLYRARSDPRFQEAGARADQILARLLENENTRSYAFNDTVPITPKTPFRWGK